MKKETWKTVFQIVISILTAIAASLELHVVELHKES